MNQDDHKIPNTLECEYCERSRDHGGECQMIKRGNISGCLGFKEDLRGCLRRRTGYIQIPLMHRIPGIGIWSHDEFGDIGEIRIIRILAVDWYESQLKIGCEYEHYWPYNKNTEDRGKLIVLKRERQP